MNRFAPVGLRALLAALALSAVAAPAAAAEYTIFIFETPADLARRTDASPNGAAYWAAFGDYAKSMQAAGVLRGGSPLQAGSNARVVAVRNGGTQVSTGSAIQAKEELGGYFLIDVPTLDAALDWAAKAPAARTARIEVRPAFPAPAMR